MMKRGHTSTILLTAVLLLAGTEALGADLAASGRLLHSWETTDLDGETVRLSDLAGEVVVVNFWASWCAPCVRELPVLNRWHQQWQGQGARVVAISIDRKPANAADFVASAELELDVWLDGPQGLAAQLDLAAVPTSYVLDRAGKVVLRIDGSSTADLERMHQKVQQLLASGKEVPRI